MSWREDARKVQRENKIELQSLPEHWVIVRKFTVLQNEKMNAWRDRIELDKDGIPKPKKEGEFHEFFKLVLSFGILDSDLTAEDNVAVSFQDNVFLDELMEYADVAEEIYTAVLKHNRPLAKANDDLSETAQNGLAEEVNSKKETASQTEPTL